jgi:hypothetical protein
MNKKSRLENIDMRIILFTVSFAATAAAGSGPDVTARIVG